MKTVKKVIFAAILMGIGTSYACDFIFVNDSNQAVVLEKPADYEVKPGQDWVILIPAGKQKKITGAVQAVINVFQQKAANNPLFELKYKLRELQCATHEITLKYSTLAQHSDDYFDVATHSKIDYTQERNKEFEKDLCEKVHFKNTLKRHIFVSSVEIGLLLAQNQVGTIKNDRRPFLIWIEKTFGGNEFIFDSSVDDCPEKVVKIRAPKLKQLAAKKTLDTIRNATSIEQVKQIKKKLPAELIELIINTAHDEEVLLEVAEEKNLQALLNFIEFGALPKEELYKNKFNEGYKNIYEIETTEEIKDILNQYISEEYKKELEQGQQFNNDDEEAD